MKARPPIVSLPSLPPYPSTAAWPMDTPTAQNLSQLSPTEPANFKETTGISVRLDDELDFLVTCGQKSMSDGILVHRQIFGIELEIGERGSTEPDKLLAGFAQMTMNQ